MSTSVGSRHLSVRRAQRNCPLSLRHRLRIVFLAVICVVGVVRPVAAQEFNDPLFSSEIVAPLDAYSPVSSEGSAAPSGDVPSPPPWPVIAARRVAAFDNPVHVTGAGDGSGRLFVVELSGKIWIIQDGVVLPTPFMDLISKLDCGDGRLRLLSLVFPPGFGQTKQHFYVKHLDRSCNVVIARYRTTANPNVGDLSSEQIVLSQPVGDGLFGGPIYFGPDGFLYASLGDGSHSDTDAGDNAQDPTKILGKMLRLDVETNIAGTYIIPPTNPFADPNDGVRDEIWASGLRNPWRFTFDRATGDLYIGDVGSQRYEEINFQPAGSTGGQNYGWKVWEGVHCFGVPGCSSAGFTPPLVEYDHSVGCSVTGGVVYRGTSLPGLQGTYLYGDLCNGNIYGLRHVNGAWQTGPLASTEHGVGDSHSAGLGIVSFGEDDEGNVFMLDYGHAHDGGAWDNGGLYIIELRSTTEGPLAFFSAAPASIMPGESSVLSWTTTNAVTTAIDQGLGTVAASGSLTVSPITTTTYTLTATDGNDISTTKSATVTVGQPPPPSLAVTPQAASQILLTWTFALATEQGFAIERCQGASCVDFLEIGRVAADVTSYTDSGVHGGTPHRYRVRAFGDGWESPYSTIRDVTTPPDAPTALSARVVSATQTSLSWTDVAGETGYSIERCASSGCTTFAVIAEVGPNVTAFANANLTPGVLYRYRIRARNSSGASAYSNIAESTTVPSSVSGLSLTVLSDTSLRLTWVDAAAETGYRIERCTGVGCATFVEVGQEGPNVVTRTDSGLAPATLYRYRVVAFNAGGNAAPSTFVEKTTLPMAPANLTVTNTSATQTNLSWTDVAGETGYSIERCASSGCTTFAVIAEVGPNVTAFANASLSPGVLYRYRIRARNSSGASAFSNIAESTTIPSSVSGLSLTVLSDTSLRLTWVDAAAETGYRIERCTGVGCATFVEVGQEGPNVVTRTESGLTSATLYRYRVVAFNAGGNAAPSTPVEKITLPMAPANLTVTNASATQINLSWADVAGESGYQVERCTGSGCVNFIYIAPVGPNVTTFVNTSLASGTTYRYRVRANNASGASLYSNLTEAVTTPPAPASLVATPASSTEILVRWTDTSAVETGFQIERCLGAGCTSFVPLQTVGPNIVTLRDSALSPSTIHRYRVRAFNAAGPSVASNVAESLTPPQAPGNVTAVAVLATQITLTWSVPPGSSGVAIERCSGTACTNFAAVANVAAGATLYANAALSPGTLYRYRLRAFNTGGNSGYSSPVDATTPPQAPGGLTATTVSTTQLQLRWADTIGETEYRIQRCAGAGCTNFAPIAGSPVAGNVISLPDNSVLSATLYRYRVHAFNAGGLSAASNIAEATTWPTPPANLVAITASATQINLTWGPVPSVTGVRIERCGLAGCANFAQIAQVGAGVISYANSALAPGTIYRYRVRAFNAGGNSAYSMVVDAITQPPAPGSIAAVTNSPTQITLSWTDVSTAEAGFRMERCAGAACTTFVEVGQVAANVVTFVNSGLAPSTIYRYRVKGFNAGGDSLPSVIAQASTGPAP